MEVRWLPAATTRPSRPEYSPNACGISGNGSSGPSREHSLGEGPELPFPEIPQAFGEYSGRDGRVVAAGNHRTSIEPPSCDSRALRDQRARLTDCGISGCTTFGHPSARTSRILAEILANFSQGFAHAWRFTQLYPGNDKCDRNLRKGA